MGTFYKAPTSNYWSTTLNGAINDSVQTITLTSVTGLQSAGVVVINRVNSAGTSTPSAREVVHYTGISSNDLTGCTRGEENSTARSHIDGSIVEAVFTVEQWNDLRDAVAAVISSDGANVAVTGTASIAAINVPTMTGKVIATTSVASLAAVNTPLLTASTATIYDGNIQADVLGAGSIASIARAEIAFAQAWQVAVPSIASVARIEYSVGRMALNSNASGGVACDFDVANLFTRTLNAATTISLTNWGTGDKAVVRLIQGVSGASVVWFPGAAATINWVNGGTAPALTYSLNKKDVFGFIGSSDIALDGYIVGQNL